MAHHFSREVDIALPDGIALKGDLHVPANASGMVLFAHGSGSSRKSGRNQYVARRLNDDGIATFLFDLLTAEEERIDNYTRHLRFDIHLLATRLANTTVWLEHLNAEITSAVEVRHLLPGYFGASTGGAAAIVAASMLPDKVVCVVSRGGRPDLAGDALRRIQCNTLLVVGGLDYDVIELNREAKTRMESGRDPAMVHKAQVDMKIIPGATHLFEEPGTLERVADVASEFFVREFSKA